MLLRSVLLSTIVMILEVVASTELSVSLYTWEEVENMAD